MSRPNLATKFDRAEESPGFGLWQLSNQWQAQQRQALKPLGLTHVQFVLLATTTYSSEQVPMTQKQLAEAAKMDAMMTSQVVRSLEQKGLMKREPSQTDRRAVTVAATEAGVRLVNQAIGVVEAVDERFFGVLGRELPEFVAMMRRLTGY